MLAGPASLSHPHLAYLDFTQRLFSVCYRPIKEPEIRENNRTINRVRELHFIIGTDQHQIKKKKRGKNHKCKT